MDCYWPQCSNRKRCTAFGSCVAKAQAGGGIAFKEPGGTRSEDYQCGWDDCLDAVDKVLGESFTRRIRR